MTYLRQMDWYGFTVKNLAEKDREAVRSWRWAIRESLPEAKYGLWIFGQRVAGTSYLGLVTGAQMAFKQGYLDAQVVSAIDLLQQLRGVWSAGALMRSNADDVGLYWEAVMAEDDLQLYFTGDLLIIDDLHDETIDWSMWRKHIQPLVEQRVKAKMATIVCTTMPPDDTALPKGLVNGLFQTLHCDGYRPEKNMYTPPTASQSDAEG